MRLIRSAIAFVGLAALLVGCGGSGDSSSTVFNAEAELSEASIAQQAGFTPHSSGIGYEYEGCDVAVVLTDKQEIELYAGAGDTVVTDPTGSFGVKTEDSPVCVNALTIALKKVESP